ncbi:MAG TPA: leucine--tRNA ligase [Polyangiaceae bacterium LLY-WYZ-14_1]|nr:leucine--tRNA ligase [Polyangiaceae bacterium LLY-WYZ-14_1]
MPPTDPPRTDTKDASGPPHRYTAALADRIEGRWQAFWDEDRTFQQPNPGEPGFDASRPKFYCLDMFPYPSGAGLHVGHPEGYTATDILCRLKRMKGYNVLHPMGWDAFGLPAEQYAIRTGIHPSVTTRKAIDNFRRQLKRFGFSYDWSRELGTIDPDYYRWTQWIFLQIYGSWFDPEAARVRPISELVAAFRAGERPIGFNPGATEVPAEDRERRLGDDWDDLDPTLRRRIVDSWRLAFIARQTVNWCPALGTVLANEEVIDGRSERGDHPVLRKPLEQWVFRITALADRLLAGLDGLDWPESTLTKQGVWIGRSEGAEIDFPLAQGVGGLERLRVYTTRPDILFGATYMVVAPEHPLVDAVLAGDAPAGGGGDLAAIRSYAEQARNRSDLDRQRSKDKTGVALGVDAINPATGRPIPVWMSDYVLMGYGEGAIMAVPAHDERDHEFATVFGLPIVPVVRPKDAQAPPAGCFPGEGRAIDSANDEVDLDGLPTAEAKATIVDWLDRTGRGKRRVNFKLRDWVFSRQRYWGEPFPIVFDDDGNHHPVDESALPVALPELEDYQPVESEDPQPLLAKAEGWMRTTAGDAGVSSLPPDTPVTRETNTMPGWAGSCWYYLRFCDPRNDRQLVGEPADAYWMGDRGVDLYVGGAEHAVLHLLYARFWHQVLHDLGHVRSPEPFGKLFHQGLILSFAYRDETGRTIPVDEVEEVGENEFVLSDGGAPVTQIVTKMSKSLRNVVNPDDVIADFGADTFRLYEMYMGPLEASKPWNTKDIGGLFRFLQRVWRLAVDEASGELTLAEHADDGIERQLHRTVAKVDQDVERLAFNTAIAAMIELVNAASRAGGLTRDQLHRFVRVLAPFAPHLGEELWHRLGETTSVARAPWPEVDPAMLRDDEVEVPVQVKGKVRSRITVAADADQATMEQAALADPKIKELLGDAAPRKVIVVPGRLVNIVP